MRNEQRDTADTNLPEVLVNDDLFLVFGKILWSLGLFLEFAALPLRAFVRRGGEGRGSKIALKKDIVQVGSI